jgi:glycosyltransferase involved in cell wall biosynthesis
MPDELRVALIVPRVAAYSGAMERMVRLLEVSPAGGLAYTAWLPPGGLPNHEIEARLRALASEGRISLEVLGPASANGRGHADAVVIPTEYWWGAWKRAKASGLRGPTLVEVHLLPYIGSLDVLRSAGIGSPRAIDLARMPFVCRDRYGDGFAPSAMRTAAGIVTVRALSRSGLRVMAVTRVIESQLARLGYGGPLFIPAVPNGIARGPAEAAVLENPPIRYDAVFVGRFHPQKGFLDLPRIVARMKRSLGRAPRVAVCGSPDSPRVDAAFRDLATRLDVSGDLTVLGRLTREELYRAVRSSRLLLYPSYVDSFSMTVLESLCLGVPVVAYDIDALSMIWGTRAGVYRSPVGDADGIAERAATLLGGALPEEDRRKLDSESPALLDAYTWENVARDERRFLEHAA